MNLDKMKIAFDVQPIIASNKTGVGFCEAGIIKALTSLYNDNEYLFNFFALGRKVNPDNINNYVKSCCKINSCKWFSSYLYKIIKSFLPVPYSMFFREKADITHFFNFNIPPFVHGKRVVTIHDMAFKRFPETVCFKTKMSLILNIKKTLKRADKIITVSNFSKDEIIKFFNIDAGKIAVVPNGVDFSLFNPNYDIAKINEVKDKYKINGSYFLYLGTLEPRKNLIRLISAYNEYIKLTDSSTLLVLAGQKGWMYDGIFEKVRELKLEEKIIFTGYIKDYEAPILINGAVAFCFTSLYEGFGMPPLEAMACGTPVLTSNISSLPEVVGDAAILVDPYSEKEITNALVKLHNDENLRKELSEKGLVQAKKFSWDNAATILNNIYKELYSE
jgi:glycosyltransferase involved in cell wall biosynthesis